MAMIVNSLPRPLFTTLHLLSPDSCTHTDIRREKTESVAIEVWRMFAFSSNPVDIYEEPLLQSLPPAFHLVSGVWISDPCQNTSIPYQDTSESLSSRLSQRHHPPCQSLSCFRRPGMHAISSAFLRGLHPIMPFLGYSLSKSVSS